MRNIIDIIFKEVNVASYKVAYFSISNIFEEYRHGGEMSERCGEDVGHVLSVA